MPSAPLATLAAALAHARKLLLSDAALAEMQAREILKVVPHDLDATALLAQALRKQGRARDALTVLKEAEARPLTTATVLYELGVTYADLGMTGEAIEALEKATRTEPNHEGAWRALADQLALSGDSEAADRARARHIQASVNDPVLRDAASALCEGKLGIAERLLKSFLKEHPTDVGAIRMLAEVAARLGRYEDAEKLLARAVSLAPSFDAARHNYATVLHRQNKHAEALQQADELLRRDPDNPAYRNLMAAIFARLGDTQKAIDTYERVLAARPDQPKVWMSLGHTLKAAGRREDCIAAYRRSIALQPGLGEAYWSLANLKTFRFTPDEVAAMQGQLARRDLREDDRLHLHFALGKALEDDGAYAESFRHYDEANALRRRSLPYSADEVTAMVGRLKAQFTETFFRQREDAGCEADDPIFIVGLPRAGSTLVEQILASHSLVEGTMELPDVIAIAKRLGGGKKRIEESAYPQVLEELSADTFAALGAEYLERTRIQRRLGRRHFIDKMPNNFMHVGLIHLMLPRARIIDVRRHPLGCCFSCFKQHFARGQGFTYSLSDIGRYYRDYVDLMAHYDSVLPGRVLRVAYEQLVEDPEREVRRLLDHCGLPFEEGCLLFYQNDRVVRTASSEQVRTPIFSDAVEHWRHYEAWLGPLKDALGSALEVDVPAQP
ncbi:MAG: sulfotransferase [Alphaproteobacteria bacterium]|nr:sulfotransferase [Alphaproteobacteria bacterium]